jgi:predicted dehydrogenase
MALKVAVVGCGKIADGHVGEILKMANATLVGLCDLEILMAEQLAKRHKVERYYDDLDEMLEKESPDVVHITTPPQVHLPLAVKLMDAGCHVYVEKPIALNYNDAEQIVRHAEKTGKKLTVGHSFAFDPPALVMRELVREGVLGDPVHVESYFGYNLAGPFGAAILGDNTHWVHSLPGKLFHNNIDHMLNKITEFVDDEKPEINAYGSKRREESYGDVRDELMDELRVYIEGKKTTAYGTFTSHVKPVSHYARIYGTKNILHVDYNIRTVTLEHGATLPSAIGRLLPAFGSGWGYHKEGWKNVFRFARSRFHFFAGMNRLISDFYASIIEGKPLPISPRDMLRIAAFMEEIFSQLNQQKEDAP